MFSAVVLPLPGAYGPLEIESSANSVGRAKTPMKPASILFAPLGIAERDSVPMSCGVQSASRRLVVIVAFVLAPSGLVVKSMTDSAARPSRLRCTSSA